MDSSDDNSDSALERESFIALTKKRGNRSKIWMTPIERHSEQASPRPTGSDLKSIDIEKPSTSRGKYDNVKTLKRKSISNYELDQYSKIQRFPSDLASQSLSHREDPANTGSEEMSMVTSPELTGNYEKIIRPTAASGLKRSLHEVIYQFKHLMLVLNRALQMGSPFRLLTEMDGVQKFDDLVLQYQDNTGNKMLRFVQIKHKLDDTERIKASDLLADTDGAFSVIKYFNSWRKIKKHTAFGESTIKDFILCTNTGLDIVGLEKANIRVKKVMEANNILEVKDRDEQPPRYNLIMDENSELYHKLRSASDIHQLAQVLAQRVHDSQQIDLTTHIFERYHIALAREVIDIGKKRFRDDFIKNNLSARANRFRDVFSSQLLSEKRLPRKDIWKHLEKCELKLSQAFGQNPKSANESGVNQLTELPNDEIYNEEILDFFDKFVLAIDQPNEVELSNIIKREMGDKSIFNLLHANQVGNSFQNDVLNWFKDKFGCLKKKKRNTEAFVKEIEAKLCSIMTMRLSLDYLGMLKEYDIAFECQKVDLLSFMQNSGSTQKPILQLVSSAPSLVTAMRVYQTLQQAEKYNNTDSFIFTHLEELLQPNTREIVSHAFKNPREYNLLVIDCGSISAKLKSQRLWNLLVDTMTENAEKRMILIIQGDSDSSILFKIESEIFHEKRADISIGNLNKSSRRKLLQKKVVKFQGQEKRTSFGRLLSIPDFDHVEVKELTESSRIIDVDTLVRLIRDEEIQIGREVKGLGEIENYYIPRTIVRRGAGVNKDDILDEDGLAEQNEQGRIIVLSDAAGTGKSTVLTSLARKIKQNIPSMLVIRIDLTQNTHVLHEEQLKRSFDNDDTNAAVDFLLDKLLSIETDLESKVFKTLIKHRGNAALLFDGFDGISPTYANIVIDLLQALGRLQVQKLFVTTRPHADETLKAQEKNRRFSLAFYTLRPFSVANQIEFVCEFWKSRLSQNNFDETAEERLQSHAQNVIDLLTRSVNDRMKQITGIPLQTRLVAEIFQFPSVLPEILNVIDVFRGFVDQKFNMFCLKKTYYDSTNQAIMTSLPNSRRIFSITHQKFALDALFDSEVVKMLLSSQSGMKTYLELFQDVIEGKERTGIIIGVIKGKPYFTHRTLAEYFAAEFLFNTLKDDCRNQHVREFFLEELFVESKYTTIRYFLNCLLPDVSNAPKKESWQLNLCDYCNEFGETVYHTAARERNVRIISFFLNCLSPTPQNIIEFGYQLENEPTSPIKIEDDKGWKLEIDRTIPLPDHLLEKRTNLDTHNKYGKTPLHIAVGQKGNLDVVKYLLENGANINSVDKSGKTVLHDAARAGNNLDMVKYLLDKGAKINSLDRNGRTVLHDAVTWRDNLDVVKYLLDKGANSNSLDKDGRTPLYYAASRGEDSDVVKYLLEINADIGSSESKRKQYNLDDTWNKRIKKPSEEGNGQPHESRPYLAVNDNQRESNNYNENERGSNQNPIQRLDEEMTYWRKGALSFPGAVLQLKHLGFTRVDDESTVTIGNDMEGLGEVEDYYISRSIIRSVVIDEDILRDKKRPDRLVFSGINRDDLPKNLENFDIFDSDEEAKEFLKLSQEDKNNDNLHWLKAESGKFIWKKSVGDISYLLQYRNTIDSGNYNDTTCALRSEVEFATHDGPVIISDTAGSGKSTMMTYLAREIKKKAPDLLVLKIDLFRDSEEFEHVRQTSNSNLRNPEEAVRFLVDKLLIREDDNYSKMIFKSIINEQRRVVMIFDGFDEISPSYESTVINLLHGLAKHGVKKLFVITRPHTREVLEKEFNTFSYQLQPFSRDDQKEFLIKFWNNRLGSANLDRNISDRIIKYAEAILKKQQDSIDDSIYNFVGIPLQTKLVSEIFQNISEERYSEFDSCDKFEDSNEDRSRLPYKLTLIDLYKYFMDKKYYIFFNKFHADKADLQVQSMCNLIRDIFMSRHMKLAVDTLFDQEFAKKLLPSDSYVSLKCNIAEETGYNFDEPGGIVTEFVYKKPHFGHRTYAEYFVAKYLTDMLKESDFDESVSKVFVEEIFLNKTYVNLRGFMNCLLSVEHRRLHLESWKAPLQNLRNNKNQTVFHVTAAEGNAELTYLFLNCLSGESEARKTLIDREDKSGYRAVCLAAECGHLQVLEVLVQYGQGEINYRTDQVGRTPLHIAVDSRKLDVINCLLEHGAYVNCPDAKGNTPLHAAARGGEIEVVKYLVDQRADVNSFHAEGKTPLHEAARWGKIEVVKYLVERGANVNSSHAEGNTPLHEAARWGKIEVVKFLVEREANVNSSGLMSNTPLHSAALTGDIEVVKYLVERGANVNSCNAEGNTPLHNAARWGKIEVVKYLVERGANVNSSHAEGNTPLHEAARWGKIEVVKFLVEREANVNSSGLMSNTPLHSAALTGDIEVVKYLVERGANVNSCNAEGNTPLHNAARWGKIEVVEYLVEREADVNSSDTEGNMPLHEAVRGGKIEVVKYLVERGANVNSSDTEGNMPLHEAVRGGKIEVVKYLVEQGANVNSSNAEGNTPLHEAARGGKIEVVEYLVERGADVNFSDAEGNMPLHEAARGGEIEVVKYLVDQRADVNSFHAEGKTPLHEAARWGKIEVVKYLVERGANVNSSHAEGNTPLHEAARWGKIEVVKFLVEREANVNSSGLMSNTPLHSAALTGDIEVVKYLVERGANVNSCNAEGNTPLHNAARWGKIEVVEYLVEREADVNSSDTEGNMPLHEAVRGGKIEVVKYLVERGANVNSSDAKGNTPLHEAVRGGKIEVVKYLVGRGANVNSSDAKGNTPLHEAARGGKIEVVEYLVEQGADVNSSDAERNPPLHYAARWGKIEVMKYLVARGAKVNSLNAGRNTSTLLKLAPPQRKIRK